MYSQPRQTLTWLMVTILLFGSIATIPVASEDNQSATQNNGLIIEIHSTNGTNSAIVDFVFESAENLTLSGTFCKGNPIDSLNCSAKISGTEIDSTGGSDGFLHVVRENNTRTLVIGSEGDENIVQILESEFGFWIIGDFCGGIAFGQDCSLTIEGSTAPSEGGRDIFLLAFNHEGNLIAMETFGTEGDDAAGRGVVDGSSHLIFSGGISNASMDLNEDCFIMPTSVSRGILFRLGLTDGLTWAGVMTPVGSGDERAMARDVHIERIGDDSWRAIVVGESTWRYNSWRNCGHAWGESPKPTTTGYSGIYIGEFLIESDPNGSISSTIFTQDVEQDILVYSDGNNSAFRIDEHDGLHYISGKIYSGDLLPRLLSPTEGGNSFIWTVDENDRLVHSLLLHGPKISGIWVPSDSKEKLQIGVDCASNTPCQTRLERDLYFDRFSERIEDSHSLSDSLFGLDENFNPDHSVQNLDNRSTSSLYLDRLSLAISGSARGSDSNYGYFHSSLADISSSSSDKGRFSGEFVVATAITTGAIVAISAPRSFRGLTIKERIFAILAISGKTPRWRMDQGEETRTLILSQFEGEDTELTVNKIAQNCGLTRSQVYHHLSILIKDGRVLETVAGYTKYKLNPNFLADDGGIV